MRTGVPDLPGTLEDRRWMRRAVTLAKKAWGRTSPNPMVGAVVVKAGRNVGEGYHRQAGGPHAEVYALRAAGKAAAGATLYVTLEPCSTFGRTPPCCEAVKAAGIARVVIGAVDPNPRHNGRGIALLQAAGIAVTTGVEEALCTDLNRAFFKAVATGRPWVLLKLATTLDGRIATASGDSQWITGAAARRRVQKLRQWADAIMAGGETVRQDHPKLTVRSPENWPRQPQKWIYSRTLDQAALQHYFPDDPAVRAVAPQSAAEWDAFLAELGKAEVRSLLLEGGGGLAGAALQAGIVDEVEFHVAPKILTGRSSRPAVAGHDPLKLAEALELDRLEVRKLGADLMIRGLVKNNGRTGGSGCLPD